MKQITPSEDSNIFHLETISTGEGRTCGVKIDGTLEWWGSKVKAGASTCLTLLRVEWASASLPVLDWGPHGQTSLPMPPPTVISGLTDHYSIENRYQPVEKRTKGMKNRILDSASGDGGRKRRLPNEATRITVSATTRFSRFYLDKSVVI